ncbi:MAG: ornithine carbamoyltransferase, partial [Alphaproteobacteria bacterium]
MPEPRHFLDIAAFDEITLRRMLEMGRAFKAGTAADPQPLVGRTLAMLFEKPSTRTRVSFEVGMRQLGGGAILMSDMDSQLGRGETIADTARVLSRYVDAIMMRTNSPEKLKEMAVNASVPVINGLTDDTHPCQLMADVMTFEEHRGPIAGKVVAWSGDGCNVACSWVEAAVRFDFELRLACPPELAPPAHVLDWARAEGGQVSLTADPMAAAAGADCLVTDVWVSMGQSDADRRRRLLQPYQVNEALMEKAKPDAIFMHCLPAHRGEEVTGGV